MLREFNNDPFFSDHHDHFSSFDNFFAQDPLRRFGGGRLGITDGHQTRDRKDKDRDRGRDRDRAVARQDDFMDPFGGNIFRSFMSDMDNSMRQMRQHMETTMKHPDEDGHSFYHSSVSSYSRGEDGQPKYFEATSSRRQAPGGLKETRKTVRDSERELDKMALGHHINNRGHVIERRRNTRTGQQEENQDFIGIEQNDAEAFDREWAEKTRPYWHGQALGDVTSDRRRHRGIENGGRHDRDRDRDRDRKSKHLAIKNTPDVKKY